MKKSKMSEIDLHRSVADFLNWIVLPPAVWTTFPAGWTAMRRGAAGRLKGCGLQSGMPDILVFNINRTIGIELKVEGAKPTSAQLDMFCRLRRVNVPVAIVHSVDELHRVLIAHDVPLRKFNNGQSFKAPESCSTKELAQGEGRATA